MSSREAIYKAFAAKINGDIGAGGLRNSSSSSYVRGGVYRRADPVRVRSTNRPRIDIEVVDAERDGFEVERIEAVVRVHCVGTRDRGYDELDPVLSGVRTLFHGAAVTDPGGVWTFTSVRRLRGFSGATSDTDLEQIEEYVVHGSQ
jgi:hypothetical protein